jgi:hypothetical protein
MLVPYMFVDNPMSLLNGREDYGYQKALGRFKPEVEEDFPTRLHAFGGQFGPQNVAKWTELIGVERTRLPGPVGEASGKPFDVGILREMLAKGVTQVFLKQFRGVNPRETTCYSQLVEAEVRFNEPHVRLATGEWHVEIIDPPPNSHPIAEELGLRTGDTPFAFVLTSGLELDQGRIIA